MKKLTFVLAAAAIATSAFAAKSSQKVTNIDPPYWWVGMENDTLQLLINGPQIASADLSINYPGVNVVETVATDSPNYKLVYLTVDDNAQAGSVNLQFTAGKKKFTVPYQLKQRTWKGTDNPGFDASDVLYLIMPDRFADGDTSNNNVKMVNDYRTDRAVNFARHGGDIKGMADHLDYIDRLGVTAVWVNPVLENDMPHGSYHGYATTNYYKIDPRFGSNDQWRDFVDLCHKRGIKVVMDMIFNHSGSEHPWMKDMPMADWYNHPEGDVMTNFRLSTIHDPYVSDYDLDTTVNGWFVKGMPDLNQRNRHMMNYLIQNSIFWIEDSKIDGIRMDTYPYADFHEMGRWIATVENEYPHFNIVGECWYGSEGGEAFWQSGSKVNPSETHLRTVMDFLPSLKGREWFSQPTGPWSGGLNNVYDHLSLDYLFPDPQHILTFLDNHDTDRFLAEEPTSLGWWQQAQTFLLTSRGIPQIYYGTEILMNGTRENGGDGNVRRDMPGGFPGDTINVFDYSGMTDLQREAYDFLSKLLNWRKGAANEVIAKGRLKHFMPQTGLYVYERWLGDKKIDVLMNGTDEPLSVSMNRTLEILPYGTVRHDLISDKDVTIEEEMTFDPRQIMILTNF
jgi:glycosidase